MRAIVHLEKRCYSSILSICQSLSSLLARSCSSILTISSEMLSMNWIKRKTKENKYGRNVSFVTWVFGEYWIQQQSIMFHKRFTVTKAKHISRPYQEIKLVGGFGGVGGTRGWGDGCKSLSPWINFSTMVKVMSEAVWSPITMKNFIIIIIFELTSE